MRTRIKILLLSVTQVNTLLNVLRRSNLPFQENCLSTISVGDARAFLADPAITEPVVLQRAKWRLMRCTYTRLIDSAPGSDWLFSSGRRQRTLTFHRLSHTILSRHVIKYIFLEKLLTVSVRQIKNIISLFIFSFFTKHLGVVDQN